MTLTPAARLVLRKTRRFAPLACLLAAIAPTSLPAQAQQADAPAATTAAYGNWVLRCVRLPAQPPAADTRTAKPQPAKTTTPQCEIAQTIQVQGNPRPVAQLAVGHAPSHPGLMMTALLPVNVSIPGQVQVFAEAKTPAGGKQTPTLSLNLVRCVPAGCFATASIEDAVLAKLTAEQDPKGALSFKDAAQRSVAIPLSWQGLDEALQALKRQ